LRGAAAIPERVLELQPKFALANKHGVWQEKVIQAEVASA
jgi:hypothetical protein